MSVLDTFVINLQMYLSQISASQNVFQKGASTATVAKYFLSNKESLDYEISLEEIYTKTWRGM
jgi:hypothetical protein